MAVSYSVNVYFHTHLYLQDPNLSGKLGVGSNYLEKLEKRDIFTIDRNDI